MILPLPLELSGYLIYLLIEKPNALIESHVACPQGRGQTDPLERPASTECNIKLTVIERTSIQIDDCSIEKYDLGSYGS